MTTSTDQGARFIHTQDIDLDKAQRSLIKRQKPCIPWLTGYSGADKSTIANKVETRLYEYAHHTHLLDGDNVLQGLCRDLGFTESDRFENIRRVAEVARLMLDAGLIVLTAFISPFRIERRMARSLVCEGEFIEIFVDTPLAVAESRDIKGLYDKARKGLIRDFTGIDSPCEISENPEIRIDSAVLSADQSVQAILDYLETNEISRQHD